MIISPSLLSADFCNLASELQSLEKAGLSWVHFDVMDGMFVPNITFGQHVVKAARPHSSLVFDVHLMIEEPKRYLEDFKAAGADYLTIHAESTRHIQSCLAQIRSLGMKAGISLNPATPLDVLDFILDDLDMILLMSVNPGFGGQKFIPATYNKLEKVKEKISGHKDILIQVDGGVNPDNAKALVDAGADVLVCGSAFFNFPPYDKRLQEFNNSLKS